MTYIVQVDCKFYHFRAVELLILTWSLIQRYNMFIYILYRLYIYIYICIYQSIWTWIFIEFHKLAIVHNEIKSQHLDSWNTSFDSLFISTEDDTKINGLKFTTHLASSRGSSTPQPHNPVVFVTSPASLYAMQRMAGWLWRPEGFSEGWM